MFNGTQHIDKAGIALLKLQNDLLRDPALALSLLTRLPIKLDERDYEHSAAAAWAYPLVGIVTGLFACLAAGLAQWLGLPLWCAAIFAIAVPVIITGAMHEDGLGDCADGFWGGWDPAMRLKIMKDSQIGTYGVLALLISQSLRFGAMLEILRWESWVLPLLAIHISSRAVMPLVMYALPHARDTGLSRSVGKVSYDSMLKSLVIGALALVLGLGLQGIIPAILGGLAGYSALRLAKTKIGGQTGDVCGATQQIAEITLLLAIISV